MLCYGGVGGRVDKLIGYNFLCRAHIWNYSTAWKIEIFRIRTFILIYEFTGGLRKKVRLLLWKVSVITLTVFVEEN